MLSGRAFGDAGRTIVIEECLVGEEASVIALCDGRVCRMLIPSQDHKRLLNDDQGPNTGGMGAYAPAPVVTPAVELMLVTAVFEPLLAALRRHGIDYRGVIYAGIMLTAGGPMVLEFNCRFGDPETQAIVPLLQTDLAELALACIEGRLSGQELRWAQGSGVCVVAASAGYPGEVRKGLELTGDVWGTDEAVVFHAGTRCEGERIVASGGRVLGVTGIGSTLALARDRAYRALERVSFEGMQFRTDIGARGLGGPAGES
jgi:phosphoribosylamine--glycine ligase